MSVVYMVIDQAVSQESGFYHDIPIHVERVNPFTDASEGASGG